MDKLINVGLVGFGMSGQLFHAPFLDVNKHFLLKKVVERHQKLSIKSYHYVEVVKSIDDLLVDNSIELIVITSPNIYHYDQVKMALLADKHVVIEKPFTPTAVEAAELIQLSKTQKRKIFVYQNRRWDGDFLTIQKILSEKSLGDVLEYEAHFDRFTPELSTKLWREQPDPAGGNLYDLGTHLIDQAVVLFGLPKTVWGVINTQRKNSKVDDSFEVVLDYGKLKATLKAGMLVKKLGPRYIINGTKGSFIKYGIDPQEKDLKKGLSPLMKGWGMESSDNHGILNSRFDGLDHKEHIETLPGAYQDFYNNVFDVLRNKAEMKVKVEEARNVIKIIELAFESNRAKKIIKFE